MSIRLTGFFAIVLIVVFGYYYVFEVRPAPERARAEYLAGRVLPASKGKITRLTLQMRDSAIVVDRVDPDGWEITAPVRTPADPGEIGAVLRSLRELGNQQVVADSGRILRGEVNLSEFGLGNPQGYIAVGTDGGGTDTLFWGDRSPTGDYYYVRRAGRLEVMTARAWSRSPFEKGVLGLRDRRVARLRPDSVLSLEVRLGPTAAFVARQAGVWRVERPVKDLADQEAVERLLRRLAAGRAVGVAAERLTEPDAFGLARPRATLTVDMGPRLGTERVLVGSRVDGSRYPPSYLHNPELKPVFTVDSTYAADLMKTASDLRHKQIFGFDESGVDRIRIERGAQAIECRLDTKHGVWLVVEPKLHVALASDVIVFIDRLRSLRAKAFVADSLSSPQQWGLVKPSARIALWSGDDLVREVLVGAVDGRVFAKADHRPEVVEIDPNQARRLNIELVSVVPDSVTADTVLLKNRGSRDGGE